MKSRIINKSLLFVMVATTSFILEAASIRVGKSVTITLGESGEAEFEVSGLSKGSNYTFVSDTGVPDSVVDLEVVALYRDPDFDYESGEYDETSLGVFFEDTRSTSTGRFQITSEDWVYSGFVKGEDFDSEFDVIYSAKGYKLYVYGDPGTVVTITSMTGIVNEAVPAGCIDSPVAFGTITEGKNVTKTGNFCDDDDYWYSLNLTAGRKYSFTVTGEGVGGSITMFYLDQEDAADDFPLPEVVYVGEGENMKFDSLTYSGVPRYSGTHYLQIDGDYGTKFTIVGSALSTRPIDKHPLAGELVDGQVLTAVAGARNDSNGIYFDEVIDTSLYSVELKAGRLAFFETAFEQDGCVMELYDANGNCLAKNYFKSTTDSGQRFSYLPAKSGTYYVGVCQDGLEASTNDVTITGSILYTDLGVPPAEADDKPSTGNTLSVVLGNSSTEGAQQFKADGSALELNATNRVDWFILGARKDVTYNFIARTDDAHYVNGRPLKLGVYTLNAKGEEQLIQDLGDAQEGAKFLAGNNATYYIKASLENGEGCDCPYELYAWVNGEDYGFLKVDVKGSTSSLWNIKGESAKYGNGSELLLPPGTYTIQAAQASGWTKPLDQTVTVVAGNDNRTTCVLKYSDTSDPKDDTMNGAVSLAPTKAKPVTVNRSLWTNDAADWYKLSVKAYNYYEFALEESEGAAEITVYRNAKLVNGTVTGDIIMQGEFVSGIVYESGTYYLSITRANGFENVDCAYTMTAKACNIGQVKTDKTAYSVGEKAGYLTVKLSRTAKEGKVRVRYTTVEGTAVANEDYVAQTGILTWEDGDSTAKEIKIKIIPDLIDSWDENKVFHIQLDAIADDEIDLSAEYPAQFVSNNLEVTITDSSKAAPGTVQFAFGGEEMEEFANPAKPVLTVAGGDTAVLWLTRTQGADKAIAVSATISAKQTSGQEFVSTETQEIWWDDGDTETKALRIPTMRPTDAYFAAKTFTVKLAVLAADAKATVKNGTATVTVVDGDSAMDFTAYVASFPKTSGVTVKAGKADTWYFDAAGTLRSVMPAKKGEKAELTFSVTGPGRLRFSPDFVQDGDDTTCTVMIGKNALDSALDGTTADLFLGAGKVDVKITVTRGANATDETDSYLALYPQDGDMPFRWDPLLLPTLVAPTSSSYLVNPEHAVLRWSGDDNTNIRYAFSCDVDKKKVGTANAYVSVPQMGMTSYEICTACGDNPLLGNTTYNWRVDSVMLDDDGNVRLINTNKTVWTFKTSVVGAPVAHIESSPDITGDDVQNLIATGKSVMLVQGVNVTNLMFGSETVGVTWALASGAKLPQGLSIDKNTGAITGVPQKAGDFAVAVQATAGRNIGPALAFNLHVEPIELAAGTFNGLVQTDDVSVSDASGLENNSIGLLNVTVAETGKIAATATIGGAKYAFKADGYDRLVELVNGQQGVSVTMNAASLIKGYTNVLTLTVCRAGTNDWTAIDMPMIAEMTLNIPAADKKSVAAEDIAYVGQALRDNTKFKHVLAAQTPYIGYYTVTLPVTGSAITGTPQGSGYLTLTIDAKGKTKISGMAADGTSLSGSAVTGYISNDGDDESAVYVPVYVASKTTAIGGWLRLALSNAATLDGQDISSGAMLPVIDGDSKLVWANSDAHAAYDGESWSSFTAELSPVGGYYSTIVNLQAYYKRYALYLADFGETDQLPAALKGEDYEWSAYPGMLTCNDGDAAHGLYVDMVVNTPTVEKSVIQNTLDVNGKKTKLIDWGASTNPCKFTLSFKSATGLFSGSFDLYASKYDDNDVETEQKKVGSFKHQGVMIMTRDETAPLSVEDAVMSGFYTVPAKITDSADKRTYTWNVSYQLLIGAEEILSQPTEGWDEE
ncbi:MAG: putative Ig domain-containing protein [Kiritimatiellae bacterium]|nr:putative Ig domain-containing protein [Kiritimatiellia bacterium]